LQSELGTHAKSMKPMSKLICSHKIRKYLSWCICHNLEISYKSHKKLSDLI
jgi:hypothetical protein